jgi:sugar-specific transcriptional regulator TrmB
MSHERVLKALVGLGLSEVEAEVYVFLAKTGPQKARNIADALKMYEQQLNRSLESLQDKGIVIATSEHSSQFSAIPFDRALDLLIKAHLEEARDIEHNKREILSQWRSMITGDSGS